MENKELYTSPEIELVEFDGEDIITTSLEQDETQHVPIW